MKGLMLVVLLGVMVSAVGMVNAKTTVDEKPVKLIVNSADAGLLHAINLAIEKTYLEGPLTTCAVIVPGPYFHHFADFSRKNPGLTVGVHLAVASGLFPVPCKPIAPRTEVPALVDHQGFMWDNLKDFDAAKPTYEQIKRELTAQVELAYMEGIDVAFLDNHIGNTEDIRNAIAALMDEFALPQKGHHGEVDVMDGIYMTPPKEAPARMAADLDKNITGPGVYLSRHHPAWMTPELEKLAAGSMPYAPGDFGRYRQGEATAIMSPEVQAVIKKKDIQLIGFYKEKRDEIRAALPKEKREAILKRIADLRNLKYDAPEGLYVFNGTPAQFTKTAGTVAIDGSFKSFKKASPILMDGKNEKSIITPRKGGGWDGKKDLQGDLRIMYDDEKIYFGVKVVDDKAMVNTNPRYEVYNGDCLEIYLNTDPAVTYDKRGMVKWVESDDKFLIAPTCVDGNPVVNHQGTGDITDQVEIAVKAAKKGYVMEVAIPRSMLKRNAWKTGDKLRFEAAITDSDNGTSYKSKLHWSSESKRAWANPDVWGVAEVK